MLSCATRATPPYINREHFVSSGPSWTTYISMGSPKKSAQNLWKWTFSTGKYDDEDDVLVTYLLPFNLGVSALCQSHLSQQDLNLLSLF